MQHPELTALAVLHVVTARSLSEALSQAKIIWLLYDPAHAYVLSTSQVCRKIKDPLLLLPPANGGLLWPQDLGSGPAMQAAM